MENNIYDMTTVNSKQVRKAASIEKAAGNFLKEHNDRLANELKAEEERKLNEAMSGARFSQASSYARNKERVQRLSEEIRYTNDSSTIAMTEMVAEVVEKSLLLDESEFEALHPGYKEDLRDIIHNLLENAEVEENISNKDTLTLMEYVAHTLPNVKEGVNLTEDELSNYIASRRSTNVDDAINNLSGNVSSRVASLMEKEQKKVNKINAEIAGATGSEEDAVPDAAEGAEEGMPQEQPMVDENGNPIDPAMAEQPMTDENGNPIDPAMAQQQPMADPNLAAQGLANPMLPKKQVQLLPDGTMNVNIYENVLVRETPRCGLIESLAVNEAVNMLKEGKEYNPDLAIANSIMYVTVTEALDEMGIITVNDRKYQTITEAAGGRFLPNSNKKVTLINKEAGEREESTKVVKEKRPIKESVICAQEAPRLNKYTPNDMAERIRQRKLLREQEAKANILNESAE